MKNIITVYDNFFDDPNNVREEALKQDFYYCDQLSNTATIDEDNDNKILEILKIGMTFPGQRSLLCENILPKIYKEFQKKILALIPNDNITINALFQRQTKNDERNIHQDGNPVLAGVIYLDNNPAPDTGTCFYKHKETGWDGSTEMPTNVNMIDKTSFEKTSIIENKFNRMIMYNANLVHSAEGARTDRLTVSFFVYPGM